MKVAIFASAFYPSLGGVEELVRQLVHTYSRCGIEAHVLTHRWPEDLPEEETFEGIPVHRLPFLLPDEINGWKANLRSRVLFMAQKNATQHQLEALLARHKFQLLHVQCITSSSSYALQAARHMNLPLVVTSQGERTMDSARTFDRSPLYCRMMRDVLEAADFVTACSQDTLSDLEAYMSASFGERGRVIHNGIALEDFEGIAPHRGARPYILGIGRFVPQKGFDVLLRAFAQAKLEGYDLLLAGDGEEYGALERLISQLGLQGRAQLLGRADRPRAVALFKGCEFFVLPSRREPQGIVNLEAMAAGRAVIATRVGGVPEIVLENETGLLVPPDDVAALSSAIQKLAADPELCRNLGQAGAHRAAEFTWPQLAERYREIYESVLSTPSSA